MVKRCLLSALLMLALSAAACAGSDGSAVTPAAASEASPGQSGKPSQDYRISPGDTVSVAVWGQERFSQDCQVNASGTISYSLLGDVPATGLTSAELQARLTKGLEQYLKRPQVLVRVSQYGAAGMSVFVLGEVKSPGVYPLTSGGGLMQALAAAGGATTKASGQVTIVKARTGKSYVTGLEQALITGGDPQARPEPGDVVFVNRKESADGPRRYTVLGEVPTPGLFDMPEEGEAHVLDAMQKAGLLGAKPSAEEAAPREATADLEHALLVRGEEMVPLDLAALLRGDVSQDLLLQPGDVLTIPRRPVVTVLALGEVRSPGKKLLPEGARVMDLIGASGGGTSAARLTRASLLRRAEGKPQPIPVDVGALLRGEEKQNVALQEGDVLFVPAKTDSSQDIWRWVTAFGYFVW